MARKRSAAKRGMQVVLLASISTAALVGCGVSARQIVVYPAGGVVALSANTAAGRAKAMEIMEGHCPAGFDITREEEVPVGERVREETRTEIDRRDRVTSTTEYRVRTQHEWRIHYTCR